MGKSGGLPSGCLGNAPLGSGEPIPWFFVSGVCRVPFAVRSRDGGRTLAGHLGGQPSIFSPESSPPQPWDNAKGISLNAALWNAQHRTKTMSAESGLATAHLLAPDFVRFQLSAQASQRGESRGKPSRWVLEGVVLGISTVFEADQLCPRTQPTASQLPRKTAGNKTTRQKRKKQRIRAPTPTCNAVFPTCQCPHSIIHAKIRNVTSCAPNPCLPIRAPRDGCVARANAIMGDSPGQPR